MAEYYYVADSVIEGKGCFAKKDISKGTIIEEYKGRIISKEESDRLDNTPEGRYIVDCNGIFIDGNQEGNEARFFNHSCDNNVHYEIKNNQFFLVASKDIKKGEELTWDYEYEDKEPIECRCGSHQCRGYMNHPSCVVLVTK